MVRSKKKAAWTRSIADSTVPDSTSDIKVMVCSNVEGKRTYDKIYYCMYCRSALKLKIKRHLETKHQDESEVKELMQEPDKKKQGQKLTYLRNLGNHLHNTEVIKKGAGDIVVAYRPAYLASWYDYVPCEHCLGYYAKFDLYKHVKRCTLVTTRPKKFTRHCQAGRLLLPTPGVSQSVNKLLCTLSSDEVARVVKSDPLILKLAEKLYLKHGHDRDQYAPVRNTLRETGRLLLELRKITRKTDAGLEDFIGPLHFQVVLDAVHGIAGFDLSNHTMATPSLALKVGHSLKKCAKLIKGAALQSEDEILATKAERFIELLEMEWTDKVSTHALRTLGENKRNRVQLLPLTNDCAKMCKWLREKATKANKILEEACSSAAATTAWCELSETLLSLIILFNRRRSGEVSRMKLTDFAETHQSRQEDILKAFTPFEQKLCKSLHRIEIVGKRGRSVPVLLTADMNEWMRKVVCPETRHVAGVDPSNVYIFASRYGSVFHLRGTDTLREHSSKCGAKQPELIRSTRLRKQVATLSQILNLKDNELDVLANFLGHDVRIHRDFYRLPEDSVQVAKVSKILVASEQGTLSNYQGKSLDEMEVDIDEGKMLFYP